jgi:hypothetical protein
VTKESRNAEEPIGQHKLQVKLRMLDNKKKAARENIFRTEDELMAKRDELIEKLLVRLKDEQNVVPLFTIRWTLI